ncbi:MAG: hypothetical protein U1E43_01315 [Rhodospirillales bacterium]
MNTAPVSPSSRMICWAGRDLVRLAVDLDVREDDGRSRGECRQGLAAFAVVEAVEAAAQGLAVERDNRLFARPARQQQGLGMARNAPSRASVSGDCSTVRSVFTTGARFRSTPKW